MRSPLCKNKEEQEWWCTFWNSSYYPKHQPVKKEATFDLPGLETDSHGNVIGDSGPLITTLDDSNKQASTIHIQKAETTRSVKALEKAGCKFTDYHER